MANHGVVHLKGKYQGYNVRQQGQYQFVDVNLQVGFGKNAANVTVGLFAKNAGSVKTLSHGQTVTFVGSLRASEKGGLFPSWDGLVPGFIPQAQQQHGNSNQGFNNQNEQPPHPANTEFGGGGLDDSIPF